MRVSELIEKFTNLTILGDKSLNFSDYEEKWGDIEISSLSSDSRQAEENSLFIAISGELLDGHDFIGKAVLNGAKIIIIEQSKIDINKEFKKSLSVFKDVLFLISKDTRRDISLIAAEFYGNPSDDLTVIGITGTNGKTTTAWITHFLLKHKFGDVGLISTIHYDVGIRKRQSTHTTPDPVSLQKLLSEMKENGCKAVVMEVSSHALDQKRCLGIKFDVVVFHNLTQDHLDYHENIESYFNAKALLFKQAFNRVKNSDSKKVSMIINYNDAYGRRLIDLYKDEKNVKMLTFGFSNNADFKTSNSKNELTGSTFKLEARGKINLVRLPLIGDFNVLNSTASLAICNVLKINLRESIQNLTQCPQTPGRMQRIAGGKLLCNIFIDYAHTPDALKKLLIEVKKLNHKRLIVLFGTGGDRDKSKREIMGRIASNHSDICVITSDNPRREDPEEIISQILKGVTKQNAYTITNRKTAIKETILSLKTGDILIIAGKGHEEYQEINGERYRFSDMEVAEGALNELREIREEENAIKREEREKREEAKARRLELEENYDSYDSKSNLDNEEINSEKEQKPSSKPRINPDDDWII